MYERTNEEIVMEKLKPKLFSVMKTYTKEQFVKDVIAGIIVAIIALPLSIALALASGVNPERGLYTAIVAGFIIAFLGGSRVQISGPTAAFATIVAGIVASDGIEGLAVATIMAGIFLILMGVLRLGGLIRFIPYTITTGFTAGIAVTIAIGQVKDFLGLQYEPGVSPIETVDKVKAVCHYIGTINVQALLVGLACMAVLILWPMLTKVLKGKAAKIVGSIPPSLLAVILGIALDEQTRHGVRARARLVLRIRIPAGAGPRIRGVRRPAHDGLFRSGAQEGREHHLLGVARRNGLDQNHRRGFRRIHRAAYA